MAESGYPGKKGGVGGSSLERVEFEADKASKAHVQAHEILADPHSQYTTDAEVTALVTPLIPRFVTYWKWS